jgi:hypothetical protein
MAPAWVPPARYLPGANGAVTRTIPPDGIVPDVEVVLKRG